MIWFLRLEPNKIMYANNRCDYFLYFPPETLNFYRSVRKSNPKFVMCELWCRFVLQNDSFDFCLNKHIYTHEFFFIEIASVYETRTSFWINTTRNRVYYVAVVMLCNKQNCTMYMHCTHRAHDDDSFNPDFVESMMPDFSVHKTLSKRTALAECFWITVKLLHAPQIAHTIHTQSATADHFEWIADVIYCWLWPFISYHLRTASKLNFWSVNFFCICAIIQNNGV